ncbi:hypothetical protein BDW72DRAFT_207134 [Aspergillus terricola var. indicus]
MLSFKKMLTYSNSEENPLVRAAKWHRDQRILLENQSAKTAVITSRLIGDLIILAPSLFSWCILAAQQSGITVADRPRNAWSIWWMTSMHSPNFIPGQGLPRHSEHPDLAPPKSGLDRLLDESMVLALDVFPLICSKRQIATATVLKVCGGAGLIGAKFCELETVEPYGNDSDMTSHLPLVGETKGYRLQVFELT